MATLYKKNAFRVVTSAKGGGTRKITLKADESISVKDVTEQAKKFFFKDGTSTFGIFTPMIRCATFKTNDCQC